MVGHQGRIRVRSIIQIDKETVKLNHFTRNMAPTATPVSIGAAEAHRDKFLSQLPKSHTWHGSGYEGSFFNQRIRHPWEETKLTDVEKANFIIRDTGLANYSSYDTPRSHTAAVNVLDRKTLSENYERQISGREGWWRKTIRETPIPGSYETFSFLKDLEDRPHTYRFKSDGRKIDPDPHGKGAVLLPGAYEHSTSLDRLEKSPATYNFRTVDRMSKDFMNMGIKDKDVNVCPSAYETEKYLTLTVEKQPSRHFMFRSETTRFPTLQFQPKEGPAPGNYDYLVPRPLHGISSSFKSKTPRFSTSHTKVPGPGMYERTVQHPMSNTVNKMGRQHGLFFSSAFQA